MAVVVGCVLASGCATPKIVEPKLRSLTDVALVSVSGTHDGGWDAALPTVVPSDDVADAAIELLLGDTLGLLESIYGQGHVMAPKDVARVVDVTSLPEMPSLERWSRVDDMPVVDIDHRRTPDALARVARRLDVDAVVVVHHMWWLSYDRSQILRTTYLTDRCTVVLVDRDGVVLWRDTASARAVVRTALAMPSPSSLGPTGTVGELTRLARQTGRMASAELTATVMRLPALPPGPAVRTREPPPPLHGPSTP